jgi:hypothetical protein
MARSISGRETSCEWYGSAAAPMIVRRLWRRWASCGHRCPSSSFGTTRRRIIPSGCEVPAAAAKIEIVWLPFRSPELNPCEDLWRLLKGVIAANRAYASLEEEAERAVAWLDTLTTEQRLRGAGLKSSKFLWLSP